MTIKIRYERADSHCSIETRSFKNLNIDQFLHDLVRKPWDLIGLGSDVGRMEDLKDAPNGFHKCWCVKSTNEIILKKKAAGKNNIARWEQYKQAQNSPSIEIGDEG